MLIETDISSWTVEHVEWWLEGLGLGEYKETFSRNCVCGEDLLELQEADLVTLRVEKMGHRKKILRSIPSPPQLANRDHLRKSLELPTSPKGPRIRPLSASSKEGE